MTRNLVWLSAALMFICNIWVRVSSVYGDVQFLEFQPVGKYTNCFLTIGKVVILILIITTKMENTMSLLIKPSITV